MVDGNADGGGIELGNAGSLVACLSDFLRCPIPNPISGFSNLCGSYLQLSQREAAAETCPAVVLDGAAFLIRLRRLPQVGSITRGQLTGIGQSAGACRPGGGQRQQPSHGVPDGGRPSCRAVFHRRVRDRFPPHSIVVCSSAMSLTWSKWHRTRRCQSLRKSEKFQVSLLVLPAVTSLSPWSSDGRAAHGCWESAGCA